SHDLETLASFATVLKLIVLPSSDSLEITLSTFSLVRLDFCFAKRTISSVFRTCLTIELIPFRLPIICSSRSLTRLLVSICLCHCSSLATANNSSVRFNCSSCCDKNCLLVQK